MAEVKLSMKEIARLAGTSIATVSRVINGNGRFSKETEDRVRSVIERYNYKPNMLAKGLREDRMQAIGVMVSDITSAYFSGIVHAIEAELFRKGYATMLCDTFESEQAEKRFLDMLDDLRFSGLIYVGGKRTEARLSDLPVIYVDRMPAPESIEPNSCYIGSDNFKGGYLATKALLDAGKTRPAIVLFEDHLETLKGRLNGFRQALEESGIAFDPGCIFHIDRVDYEDGAAVTRRILSSEKHFDSIFFTSDIVAIGGIQYMNQQQIAIPEQIAVVGMDGIPQCERIDPPLTTVSQQYEQFGILAANTIIKMIEGEPVSDRILDVSLIRRRSV